MMRIERIMNIILSPLRTMPLILLNQCHSKVKLQITKRVKTVCKSASARISELRHYNSLIGTGKHIFNEEGFLLGIS